MVTLYWFEFTDNLAVSIGGWKRENFQAGDRVVVTQQDYLMLLRLGCVLVWTAELTFKDVESLLVSPEEKAKEAEKASRATQKAQKEAAKKAQALADAQWALDTANATVTAANEKVVKATEAKEAAQKDVETATAENADEARMSWVNKVLEEKSAELENAQKEAESAKTQLETAQKAFDELAK